MSKSNVTKAEKCPHDDKWERPYRLEMGANSATIIPVFRCPLDGFEFDTQYGNLNALEKHLQSCPLNREPKKDD